MSIKINNNCKKVSTISVFTEKDGEIEGNSTNLRWLDGTLVAFVIENALHGESLPRVFSSRPCKSNEKENKDKMLIVGRDGEEITLTPEPTLTYRHEDSVPIGDNKIRTFGIVSVGQVVLLDQLGQEVPAKILLQIKQSPPGLAQNISSATEPSHYSAAA